MHIIAHLLPIFTFLSLTNAATKDEWRSRSVYQVITDRFAPQQEGAPCNTADHTFCGGTWNTLAAKLDYIQQMGYDAVWISPTALNIEGPTAYGLAYHGYWGVDPTQINPHFGTSDDLKSLSAALHAKDMYLMVDLAINNLCSQSADISAGTLTSDDNGSLLFKDTSDYHPSCNIDWGNHTSEMDCWLATSGVTLMDLDQSNQNMSNTLMDWVPKFVAEYSVDGFRLDASKHMPLSFQKPFCDAAGVFCIGEVAGDDTAYAGTFQGPNGIDAVFGFGMLNAWQKCFTGGQDMSVLEAYIKLAASSYSDPTLIGSFLDNQDQPRFNSLTSDKSSVYNAIVGAFLYGGIPTIYYGLEQDIDDGSSDPANREALWLYNDFSTTASPTYARIAMLNKIRSTLGKNAAFLNSVSMVAAVQSEDIALSRAGALIVLTRRGTQGTGTWQITNSSFSPSATVIDLFSCNTSAVGSDGSLNVVWTDGQPFVFITSDVASSGGFCGANVTGNPLTNGTAPANTTSTPSSDPSGSTGGVLLATSSSPSGSAPSASASNTDAESSGDGTNSSSCKP